MKTFTKHKMVVTIPNRFTGRTVHWKIPPYGNNYPSDNLFWGATQLILLFHYFLKLAPFSSRLLLFKPASLGPRRRCLLANKEVKEELLAVTRLSLHNAFTIIITLPVLHLTPLRIHRRKPGEHLSHEDFKETSVWLFSVHHTGLCIRFL